MAGPADSSDPLERLIALLGPRLDDVRGLFDDASVRWRGDAVRVSEGTRRRLLELRVAQLEHRLRLVEQPPTAQQP
jgi:hypothetical protein